jgi:hypothetical protein
MDCAQTDLSPRLESLSKIFPPSALDLGDKPLFTIVGACATSGVPSSDLRLERSATSKSSSDRQRSRFRLSPVGILERSGRKRQRHSQEARVAGSVKKKEAEAGFLLRSFY